MGELMEFAHLPQSFVSKVQTYPEYRMGAHLVSLILRDGRRVKNVVVTNWGTIWGIDQRATEAKDLGFEIDEIIEVVHQPWTDQKKAGEKPWWDPTNSEWWKS